MARIKKRNMVEIEIYANHANLNHIHDDVYECDECAAAAAPPPNELERQLIVDNERSARKFEFTIMYFGLFFCGMITGVMLLLLESDQRMTTEECRIALQNFDSFESVKHKCYFE